MAAFQQQTIVRSFKLKIKNSFKSIEEETENIVSTLQSRVSWFREKVNALVFNSDENFFPLYKSLCSEFEKYQESLFYIQALLEAKDDVDETTKQVEKIEEKQRDAPNPDLQQVSPESSSSQTFCKSLLSQGSLTSSKSHCSIQDNSSASQLSKRQTTGKISSGISLEDISPKKIRQEKCHDKVDAKGLQYSQEVKPAFPKTSCHSLSPGYNKVSLASENVHQSEQQKSSEIEKCDSLEKFRAERQPIYNEIRLVDQSRGERQEIPNEIRPAGQSRSERPQLQNEISLVNQISTEKQYSNDKTKPVEQCKVTRQPFSNKSRSIKQSKAVTPQIQNTTSPFEQSNKKSQQINKEIRPNEQFEVKRQQINNEIRPLKQSRAEKQEIHNESSPIEQSEAERQPVTDKIRPGAFICPPTIPIPSLTTGTLSHLISPDDFWLQLEDSNERFSFPTVEFFKKPVPSCVQPGDFCLALSNKVNIYYRAKVLTQPSSQGVVEVFFIDHGSIQEVNVWNLRVLPNAAYQIPMQAFQCYLCDISPTGGSWSTSAIGKFKEYEGSCKVKVECFKGGKYGVQLIIKIMDYDLNISEVLCEDGFAVFNKSPSTTQIPPYTPPAAISNHASYDSGVSITSNHRSSPCNQRRLCISSEMLTNSISTEPLQRKTYPSNDIESPNLTPFDARELISFESNEHVYNVLLGNAKVENEHVLLDNTKVNNELSTYKCTKNTDCNCMLHLVVPPPLLSCVEKNMMLVMISNIVSPGEFYVNPAMEDSFAFDELREKMTSFYEASSRDLCIAVEDIYEGLFCAGRFDQDRNWYRVKVLEFESKDRSDILVQYVDYGNRATIKCSKLRPLKPEFVQHPSFAIKCSLAGIVPRKSEDLDELCPWSEDATEAFQQLASFDRCLTAQIVENSMPHLASESEAVQVLLWDTVDTEDLLINEVLVAKGAAEIDYDLVSIIQNQKNRQSKEVELLNQWNPMQAEFIDVENSYGVDTDSIGVKISGYNQDDSHICKYYSLRGYCPRGKTCTFEHVPLAEGGVPRGQEEIYSLDAVPSLPHPSTHVFVQVSAVINPLQFYAILPFGSKSVDEVDSLARQGKDPESLGRTEVRLLFQELNRHYSNSPFAENTTIALSYGSIVAARRSVDSAWHRGRIVDVSDIAGPAKVFFVDFGDDSWVPRRKIREILPQFLHTPFQAVECHLSDVEPLGFEQGKTWSPHAINYFKDLVSDTVLLAKITDRCGKILHLTLRKTTENDHEKISESLVRAGFAQLCSYKPKERKKRSIYVPG